jgi:hypothetical protein
LLLVGVDVVFTFVVVEYLDARFDKLAPNWWVFVRVLLPRKLSTPTLLSNLTLQIEVP